MNWGCSTERVKFHVRCPCGAFPSHRTVRALVILAVAVFLAAPAWAQRFERITPRELESYMRWLELDDEQKAVAGELHRDYIETWEEDLLPRAQAVWKQGGGDNPTSSRRIWNEWEDVVAAALERDEAFFTSLEQVLRPEQAPRTQRVRLGRARHLWRHGTSEFPEANVDLIALVEELDLDEDTQAAVDEVIAEFEPVFVAALQDAGDLSIDFRKRRLNADMLAIHNALLEARRFDEQARIDALEENLDDLKVERGRLILPDYRRLVHINRGGLTRIMSVLPDHEAEALSVLYREAAYPHVYPDPADARALYDAASGIDNLGKLRHHAIEAARTTFRAAHDRLSREMAESWMKVRSGRIDGTPEAKREAVEHDLRFQNLALEREALNAKQALILRGILSPEQFALLPDWDFEKNPPPRPWDPHDTLRRRERLMQERAERIEEMRKQAEERQQGDG